MPVLEGNADEGGDSTLRPPRPVCDRSCRTSFLPPFTLPSGLRVWDPCCVLDTEDMEIGGAVRAARLGLRAGWGSRPRGLSGD